MDDSGRADWLDQPCPPWCQRDHGPEDHLEDRRHQGLGRSVPLTLSIDTPPHESTHSVDIIVYADQPTAAAGPWIRVESTESALLRIALTPESAQVLARALMSSATDVD